MIENIGKLKIRKILFQKAVFQVPYSWPRFFMCVYVCLKSLSRIRLFVTPWTAAHQPPVSMGFSRQEYWSGLPFPSPRDLPDPGIEPGSPALQVDSLPTELCSLGE